MSYVHLHTHSEYSLLEAGTRIKELAKRAAQFQMPAVALTDNGNMFGAVEFYFACKDAAVKPILGLDAYLAPKSRLVKGEDRDAAQQPLRKIVLLAKNYQGYQQLCQISTIGFQEGFYYKPRVDFEVLNRINSELIALSGGLDGVVASTFVRQGPDAALEVIQQLKSIYGDRFYLEVNRTGRGEWELINSFLQEVSEKQKIPLIAANDVHYLDPEDSLAQEVLVCIGKNQTLKDESRPRLGGDQFYFKSAEAMQSLFKDIPGAADNTLLVAEQCQVQFKLKDDKGRAIYHLPTYPVPQGMTLKDEMKRLADKGLQDRLEQLRGTGRQFSADDIEAYQKRLDFELSVIEAMGFNGYFLIVQDFIGWAKENGIPVGPGRGSGAGSLVAYSLKITDLDPMRYNLIFERFLNPERISMPDFDVDFCQDRRPEVINYVIQKYGREMVSQIITFGKLKAKAALRDVGRVLGMTYQEVDIIAKLVPEKIGISLSEAIEAEPRLKEMIENDPTVETMMDLAKKIENLTRHASIHAAGVVIADRPLVEYAPLYRGEGDEIVVQYDMKVSEKIGLIKFDFLGLKTLTLIDNALKLIQKNRGKIVTTQGISLEDPGIYEIMSRGDTLGIFQFEGDGISDLIRKFQPTCFEDITAINALYRPGPMQMLDEYVGRKHGDIPVQYIFPELEEILKETYGIIVYQEQVQLIAARIGSYSLGEADMLRRAMGKKIASEMAQQKGRFLEGAKKNGFDEKKSSELFDLMAKFAEYGFNKSHAAAYCVVAAQTAYLKNYYPIEFFAALLSTEMSDTDKIVEYSKDAREHGIQVNSPHVNFSEHRFSVNGEIIYFGLGAIKGVGESAVEAILEARSKQPKQKFETLEDFFGALDLRRVNKKVVECLIKAGALEDFGAHRAQLMAGYAHFIDDAESRRNDAEVGQGSLFAMVAEETVKVSLPEVAEWSRAQQLAHEKEVLGFYLSDHPISTVAPLLKNWTTVPLSQLKDLPDNARVVVGGVVTGLVEKITQKGTRMGFAQLEDLAGSVELLIFPDPYAKFQGLLKRESPMLVDAVIKREDGGTMKLRVNSVQAVEDKLLQSKRLHIRWSETDEPRLEALKEILKQHPGDTQVNFRISLADRRQEVTLALREPPGIRLGAEMLENISHAAGGSKHLDITP